MTITRVYLGNPAGPFGMQAIPAIFVGGSMGGSGVGMMTTLGRGTMSQVLVGGGTTTQRLSKTKTIYQLGWNIRGPADINLLRSFFTGVQGGGPYCLVDPSESNWLPPNVSSMGAVLGALVNPSGAEWSPAVGAIAVNTAQAPPAGALSAVAGWTGAANSSILYMGLNNIIDGTWLPPVIGGLAHGAGISAKLLSGTGSLTAAIMYGVAGSAPAGTATATAATVALNTSTWVDVSAVVASGFSWPSTADYAMLKLTVSGATSPSILLSAPWFTYDTATAAKPNPLVNGIGVPRCVIPDTASSPVGITDVRKLRDFVMSLAEAA